MLRNRFRVSMLQGLSRRGGRTMRSTDRFKMKLYFMLTAMLLLTMLISLSLSYYFSYGNQLEQLKSQMRQTVDDKIGYLGEWLNGKTMVLELTDRYRVQYSDGFRVPADVLNLYGISDVYVGYEDGRFQSFTGWQAPAGFDPRVRPWYENIRKSGRLTISDPYLDLNSQQMAVSLGKPVMESGVMTGVIAEDILIQTLIEEITRLDFSEIGFVWILNERGTFVYHPDTGIIYKNVKSVQGLSGIPEDLFLQGDREVEYQYQGAKRTALFRRIPDSQWILGVTVLENQVFRNLEHLRMAYLALSIILTTVFGAVSYFLTRILAAPIVQIIRFVKGISRGNLGQTLEIRFNREVDALADSLNQMALQLKQNFDEIEGQKAELEKYNVALEKLVQERTQDIEAVNRKLQASFEAMELQASTDYLTGISNRRSFFELAVKEITRSERDRYPFCLMIVDLDNFKQVNDRYGHAAGDAVLIQNADIMQACLRGYDVLGRLGGEEFVMLLPETDAAQGRGIAERIRENLEGTVVRSGEKEICFTASFGVVCIENGCRDCLEAMISRADEALYEAKRRGKNTVVLFSELQQ